MPSAESLHDQILKLRDVRTVSNEALEEFTKYALKPTAINEQNGPDSSVWARIRAAKPAIDFIGRYIELTPTPTGGIGYCPFHEDKHKSFGVHKDGNYWHCFAGCGGGSVIDWAPGWWLPSAAC